MATLQIRRDGPVCWLTLNRAEVRNALNADLIGRLTEEIRRCDSARDVAVVVLTGAGDHFCAGGDLKAFLSLDGAPGTRGFTVRAFQLYAAIESCSKPVVASVAGYALAGGLELCLAADFVVAADTACFGTVDPRIGMTSAYADVRLPAVIGLHNAKYLAMTGERISAAEALKMGLAAVVCGRADLAAVTQDVAVRAARAAPLALAAGKGLLNRSASDGYQHAIEAAVMLHLSEDRREGIAAFLEKRQPQFSGR